MSRAWLEGTHERLLSLINTTDKPHKQIYETIGIPKSTYMQYVMGDNVPSFTNMVKICNYFGVSLDWLATGKGEKYK